MGLISIGIRSDQITGEAAELREFIQAHISDPAEIEYIDIEYKDSSTVMGDLFSCNFFLSSEETKKNIFIAFRVYFEKNPLAILKTVLRHINKKEQWSESAMERICSNPEIEKELMPELLWFVSEYASQLQETELRRLVSFFPNNQAINEILMTAFLAENLNTSNYARNSITPKDLQRSIEKHWYPEHRNDDNFFYMNFPVLELWRLFMDGNQQGNGWKHYEARENGCINQLYQAWLYVRKSSNEPITPDYFKKIHALCALGIMQKSEDVGQFRKYCPSFGMSENSGTFLGYLEHIQCYNNLCALLEGSRFGFNAESRVETPILEITLKEIIQEYESSLLEHANNLLGMLHAIILFCKKLVLIHPFGDCNGRIFSNLLLNRELIRNGFTPALLDNPNRMDGYSINEFVSEIVRGMDAFERLTNEGLYKDMPATCELMKTQTYPILEIRNLIALPKGESQINQYHFFALSEDPINNSSYEFNRNNS